MTDTLLLFLPSESAGWRWLRASAGAIVARGDSLPALDAEEVVAVAPAEAVTLHWATLPDRSAAQATAAARILAAEASAAPLDSLHVAVGREDADERPIGVVSVESMREWLEMLARAAIDPRAIFPAPMLLPRPAEGYVRADLGGEGVVRGPTSGFADEARLTELVTGGVAPAVLDRDAVEAAILDALARAPLDLRQGMFARRRRVGIDWRLVRRIAVLAGLILAVTLAIDLVRITKYSFGADAIEAQADATARQGLPRGAVVADADRALDTRLSAVRGPGEGFSRTAAVAFDAVRSVDGGEVSAVAFEPNGDLRITLSVAGEAQANAIKQRIEQAGFSVRAGTFAGSGGRISGDFTVSAR